MTPHRRLKQARELRGWSQARVAEALGTDATTVSRWERGLFSPTPYFRERLCQLFCKNAEELGLLETVDQSQEDRHSDPPGQAAVSTVPLAANGEQPREAAYLSNTSSLLPPDWTNRMDTFSYILSSATYDQQAHMLWRDAYVRALRGQCAEARLLGEASLIAFERVGHLNANAIREWLSQQPVVLPPPPLEPEPVTAPPALPEREERPARRSMRVKGTGLVFILLVVVTCMLPDRGRKR